MDQAGDRLVHAARHVEVIPSEILVGIPVAPRESIVGSAPDLDETDIAFQQSSGNQTAFTHLAGVLGGRFAAPHGAVCAALLPQVMTTNIQALRERDPEGGALTRYRRIACLLTGDADAAADAGVAWVRQLVADLRIPPLRDYGIKPEHVAEVVASAANASSMKANPIALTTQELTTTLWRAL